MLSLPLLKSIPPPPYGKPKAFPKIKIISSPVEIAETDEIKKIDPTHHFDP